VLGQIGKRQLLQLSGFLIGQAVLRILHPVASARLDLDECPAITIASHDIDLTRAMAPVARDQLVALAPQKVSREVLSEAS
jgi:hypothetical protein